MAIASEIRILENTQNGFILEACSSIYSKILKDQNYEVPQLFFVPDQKEKDSYSVSEPFPGCHMLLS